MSSAPRPAPRRRGAVRVAALAAAGGALVVTGCSTLSSVSGSSQSATSSSKSAAATASASSAQASSAQSSSHGS